MTLGSIIEASIRHLYRYGLFYTSPPLMERHLGSLNLRIALMPIQIPDPKTGGSFTISPAQIPIDIKFFAEWWNENVVKKT